MYHFQSYLYELTKIGSRPVMLRRVIVANAISGIFYNRLGISSVNLKEKHKFFFTQRRICYLKISVPQSERSLWWIGGELRPAYVNSRRELRSGWTMRPKRAAKREEWRKGRDNGTNEEDRAGNTWRRLRAKLQLAATGYVQSRKLTLSSFLSFTHSLTPTLNFLVPCLPLFIVEEKGKKRAG